jgi:xanthine dehydrogenase accessory factor
MTREPYVEAIVVRCARPTVARPGDRAVVRPDGTIEGFVGGSCADETVRLHALRALETGEAVLVRIVPGEVDGVDDQEGAVVVANPCLSGGALEVFLEPHLPAPRVRIVGETPVARALASLAPSVGLEVADDADFAVVVASLGHGDEDALAEALETDVAYVGLVASPRRGAAVLETLRERGLPAERVHTPAGLDIGARTHDEIALSIAAELVAERRRRVVVPPPAPEAVHHACHAH